MTTALALSTPVAITRIVTSSRWARVYRLAPLPCDHSLPFLIYDDDTPGLRAADFWAEIRN